MTKSAAILGASGYTGGELARLLVGHPHLELVGATSDRLAGEPLHRAHPNLRGASGLKFVPRKELPDADVVFVCAPHTQAMQQVPGLMRDGRTVVDLSADFRLQNAATYEAWYETRHAAPELLQHAVYGLPETRRDQLRGASLISGVGCFATAMNLALLPLARAGLLADARIVVDGKIGSSAAGVETNPAGMHAERSRSHRLYAATRHRHAAEVRQECGVDIHASVHTVELVRGVLATCHILLPAAGPDEKALWKTYRAQYQNEPFVRMVKERSGIHRGPDPNLVAGSNFADVAFHVETGADESGDQRASAATGGRPPSPASQTPTNGPPRGARIVATCAIDNLVKGAAGSAIQSVNVALAWDERAGLGQLPLHPV